ncbi:hypothetical protein HY989_04165 [Candidatus Micrarchaeota archaeon]|nr:hypothetical protein [Candidatus Micrarchaeota archaeon]
MASKSFDYRIHGKGYYPTIPITLFHLENEALTDGIIDSGSNYCIFHPWVAEKVGIPWLRGEKKTISTVSEKVDVYLSKVKMAIFGNKFECVVGFAKMGTSFNLLGREGFFENHEITFKEKEKRVIITELEV